MKSFLTSHLLLLLPTLACTFSSAPVTVTVQRAFPNTSPTKAKEAWLSYTWKKGGGLPTFVFLKKDFQSRLLPPLFFEETLQRKDEDAFKTAKEEEVQYKITKWGLLQYDMQPDSHLGTVRFVPDEENNTVMTWTATFDALHRSNLWKSVTQVMISEASDNLRSYLAPPLLYTRKMYLKSNSTKEAMDAWLSFIWDHGGGLPVPRISFGTKQEETPRSKLVIPPFLQESICSIDYDNHEIYYTVDNPSLFTYQVHTHTGKVKFVSTAPDDQVIMIWQVQIRPYRNWSFLVKQFTSAIVTSMSRNFKTHCEVGPDAVVALAPPRGKGEAFGQVRKDSLMGGILASHLEDKRNVREQTVSMFMPWTWGRGDETREGEEWTVGADFV